MVRRTVKPELGSRSEGVGKGTIESSYTDRGVATSRYVVYLPSDRDTLNAMTGFVRGLIRGKSHSGLARHMSIGIVRGKYSRPGKTKLSVGIAMRTEDMNDTEAMHRLIDGISTEIEEVIEIEELG